jgi:hypothetical protein
MNLHVGTIASVFALILIQGGTGKADTPPSLQNAEGDVITQEEGLIVTTLNKVANAESQFSKTKDSASVLRFYTEDFAGIKDGKLETVKDQKNTSQRCWSRFTLTNPSVSPPRSRASSPVLQGDSDGQRMSMSTK